MKKSISEISFTLIVLTVVGLIGAFIYKFMPLALTQLSSSMCCISIGGYYDGGICYNATIENKCSNLLVQPEYDEEENFNRFSVEFTINRSSFGGKPQMIKNKLNKKYSINYNDDYNSYVDRTITNSIKDNVTKLTNGKYEKADIQYINVLSNKNRVIAETTFKDDSLITIYDNQFELQKKELRSNSDISYRDLETLENVNEALSAEEKNNFDDTFNKTINKLVKIHSVYDKTIIDSASGFFLSKGVVVTTWSFIDQALLKSDYIEIIDNENNVYEIEGIIALEDKLDLVVLKLNKYVGEEIIINRNAKKTDQVVVMGSYLGYDFSSKSGMILDYSSMVADLSIPSGYQGGLLLNSEGEVLGVAKANGTNALLSNYASSTYLVNIQNKINSSSFNSLPVMNITTLKSQYYYGKYQEETVKINVSEELYNNYRGIGDVSNTVSLEAVKVAAYNGVISFRYVNDVYSTIDTMDMALDFRMQLEKSGYKLKINSENKKYYESYQYDVVILTEFNYLIIIIVEK